MAELVPILASAATAARLLDMRESEFRKLVDDGLLPRPVSLAGLERWDTHALRRIATGAAVDGMEGVEWT